MKGEFLSWQGGACGVEHATSVSRTIAEDYAGKRHVRNLLSCGALRCFVEREI